MSIFKKNNSEGAQTAQVQPEAQNRGSIAPTGNASIGQKKTRITVKYDVGFPNTLYIRGRGANLSWDRGVVMKNVKRDEWVWETDSVFTQGEFKVLINDRIYEVGQNHLLQSGATIQYTPHF